MSTSAAVARPSHAPVSSWLFRITWLVLLLLPLVLSLPHLNGYAWNYDEGPLLQAAALANKGFPLFDETVFNKPPLLIWWLQLMFVLGGTAVTTARLSILLLNLVGLAAFGWLAAAWSQQRWAGPLAVSLWLLLPEALVRLMVIMNDLPGMTLLLLTLALTTRYRQTDRWPWAAAAGAFFGLTVGTHPLLLFASVPLAFLLLWGKPVNPKSIKPALLFGAMTLLITAIWLLPNYGDGFVRWVYDYNRAELDPGLRGWASENGMRLAHTLLYDYWLLLLLALISSLRLWVSSQRIYGQTAVLWAALTVFSLTRLNPMWQHYVIFVFYPLIILAAGGVATTGQQLWQDWRKGGQRPLWQPAILGLNIAIFLLLMQQTVDVKVAWPQWSEPHTAARDHLAAQAAAGKMAISDDPFLLFTSEHLIPPPLTDGSNKRISTGFLSVTDVLESYFTYGVDTFVFTNGRFNRLPPLQEWATQRADAKTVYGPITIVQLHPPPAPETAGQNQLGPGIRLNGYTIEQTNTAINLVLYWETAMPLTDSYHRFVHLLDENGELISQADGTPLDGWLPTNRWQPNVQIVEKVAINLSPDLPPGSYRLTIGMYTFPQIQRLAATDAGGSRWPNDAILLQEINVP